MVSVQQAGKVPARGRLLQAYQERKSWLLLPVVGVLLLGLISLSGSWECHKSNKVELRDIPNCSGSQVVDVPALLCNKCP